MQTPCPSPMLAGTLGPLSCFYDIRELVSATYGDTASDLGLRLDQSVVDILAVKVMNICPEWRR